MSVLSSVVDALDSADIEGWQRELALSLAESMDKSPNASTAKELKALVLELTSGVEVKVDVSDDLASKRLERRRASGS